MLEGEKKKYVLYRIDSSRVARAQGYINMALYFSSDRRDEDNDHLCVYLKKSYTALCDACDVREGDIIRLGEERLRVISAHGDTSELVLHLESTQILDTGAFDFEEDLNV